MKLKKFFAIIILVLAVGKISFAHGIENISVNLNDKDSCKKYISAVCAETVKLLSEENLPTAPDYDLLCRAVEKNSGGKNATSSSKSAARILGSSTALKATPQINFG